MCDEDAGEACVEYALGKWRNGFSLCRNFVYFIAGSRSFMMENVEKFIGKSSCLDVFIST
jgi:hypothetical protein